MQTRFTEHFGLRYPLVSAPMAQMSGGALAAAVSKAGGLGTFGAVCARPFEIPAQYVQESIARVRAETDRPFGVGFITHHLEEDATNFELALAEEVPVILLSFADPTRWLRRIKSRGLRSICQVQRMEDARIAVAEGADAIAVQGERAGGHCGAADLLTFLGAARAAFPDSLLLAAGGIGDRAALLDAMGAGAEGAWIGTGFRATSDCQEITAAERRAILESDGTDTVRSQVYDTITRAAFGFMPWPEHIALRSRVTPLTERWSEDLAGLAAAAREAPGAYKTVYDAPEDPVYPHLYGPAAGAISEVETAAEFMARLCG